jgi:hypothetical protein
MNAAGAGKRVARLTGSIEGFRKEAEALLADRGVLTPEEWNRYLTAIYNANDALHEARTALQMAARRWRGRLTKPEAKYHLWTLHPASFPG